jgi:hypothetical protein
MMVFRVFGMLAKAAVVPWLLLAGLLIGEWSISTAHADAYAQLDAIPVQPSPGCGGTVSAEAQVTPLQIDDRVENGVRVAIHYDAGRYDGSCALTVTADWENLDTGASGAGDITAVSTIDGHYGFIGYANRTFDTGAGTIVVTLSSHPGDTMRVTA